MTKLRIFQMKVKVLGKYYDFKVSQDDPAAKAKIIETIAKSIEFESGKGSDLTVDGIAKIFREAGVNW